jgi:hypothetical protein
MSKPTNRLHWPPVFKPNAPPAIGGAPPRPPIGPPRAAVPPVQPRRGPSLSPSHAHTTTPPAVQRSTIRASASARAARPNLVQRTTAADINAEMGTINTLAATVTARMNALSASLAAPTDLGDQDTLKAKLLAVKAQLAGHVGEVVYFDKKVTKHGQGRVFIGAYTDPTHGLVGADVTSPRKVGAKTAFKSVQLKVVSSGDYQHVMRVIVKAADQLAGQTKSGELPRPDSQRVIQVQILNPLNPFPASAPDTALQPLLNHSKKNVVDELWAGLQSTSMEPSFDKIKIVFSNARAINNGALNITTITVSRPGGARGPKGTKSKSYDLRALSAIDWDVR